MQYQSNWIFGKYEGGAILDYDTRMEYASLRKEVNKRG